MASAYPLSRYVTKDTIFTCDPFRSPKAARRCAGTSSGLGPFSPIVCTMSGSRVWMLGGMSRLYSWNSSMTISGHSVITLNDLVDGVAEAAGASFAGFAAPSSPKTSLTVSPMFLYTSQTNSRNGATSDSRLGRKFLCRSKIMRRQMRAFSSFSALRASIASLSTCLSKGLSASVCGMRFKISSVVFRSLCSGPSDSCAGVDSRTAVSAGMKAAMNFGYSDDEFTTSMASRTSTAS